MGQCRVGHVMAPLAVADLRRRYPDLLIDLDILKIEDAVDFLLLGRGEVVAMSSRLEHPAITFEPLAQGDSFASSRRSIRWRRGLE